MPNVSIITAAYNHAKYVRQSVESAQNQTYRDFEHIVIDDGSSDGTAEILKSFGDKITYIRQENRGAHAAINRGIQISSGEFIAILDSDDAWLPNKLEQQMKAFEQFPKAGMVYSYAKTIDSEDNPRNDAELIGKPLVEPLRALEHLLRENHVPILTALFRRGCLEDVGLFSETLKAFSDWDLCLRIFVRWPVIFVPEPLALYRDHGNNTWYSLAKNGRVDQERLIVLDNASSALAGSAHDSKQNRRLIRAVFGDTVLRTTYWLFCHHEYSKALRYLLFAFKLHPMLPNDLKLALKLNPTLWKDGKAFGVMAKLVFGERAIETLKHIKRSSA